MNFLENKKTVIIAIFVWILGSVLIFNFGPSTELSKKGNIFFDMQTDYTNAEGLSSIESRGEAGRSLYFSHLRFYDPLFIVLQTIGSSLLFIFATSHFAKAKKWIRILLIIPVTLGIIDIWENIRIDSALSSFPNTTEPQIELIRSMTSIKMSCLPIFGLFMLVSLLLLGSKLIWPTKKANTSESSTSVS